MRIDLSLIDREQFLIKEGVFCGEKAFLVTPALQGTQWTQANKHLRSSIWSEAGELLSAGFPKFTNFSENPEHFPVPKSLDGALCVEKLDGSLCALDYMGDMKLSCRSRGTFTYEGLNNAADFKHCLSKYPGILEWFMITTKFVSLLCEITTPNQRIILDYGREPELTLIGIIDKETYQLWPQKHLDIAAETIGLKRPRYYTFESLDKCLSDVAAWEGLEGCVIYSDAGLHKIKSAQYLRLHRFKERATLPNILELWMAAGRPLAATFRADLAKTYDNECLQMVSDYVTSISLAWGSLSNQLADLALDIEPLKNWARRDAALKIQADYTEKGLTGPAFNLLSNRPVEEKTVYRLMEKRLGL